MRDIYSIGYNITGCATNRALLTELNTVPKTIKEYFAGMVTD
jgi:hypothetical protein